MRSLSKVNVCALCAADWDRPAMCKALWSYKAQMPCDLTFAAGKNGICQ